jgi:hypothetical protein
VFKLVLYDLVCKILVLVMHFFHRDRSLAFLLIFGQFRLTLLKELGQGLSHVQVFFVQLGTAALVSVLQFVHHLQDLLICAGVLVLDQVCVIVQVFQVADLVRLSQFLLLGVVRLRF